MDKYSYNKRLNALYKNFNFILLVMHSYFEKSLTGAIKKNQYFGKKIIKLLKKIKYQKKIFNMNSILIIEILCFIKKEKKKSIKK